MKKLISSTCFLKIVILTTVLICYFLSIGPVMKWNFHRRPGMPFHEDTITSIIWSFYEPIRWIDTHTVLHESINRYTLLFGWSFGDGPLLWTPFNLLDFIFALVSILLILALFIIKKNAEPLSSPRRQ